MNMANITTESQLWQLLKSKLFKIPNTFLNRIESNTAIGIPDVCFSYCGKNGWIELKTVSVNVANLVSYADLELSFLQRQFLICYANSHVFVKFKEAETPYLISTDNLHTFMQQKLCWDRALDQFEKEYLDYSKSYASYLIRNF